jgi:NAD(P)-dependent dehydrogenase (short-subunit alcohol dehydrogenase family)
MTSPAATMHGKTVLLTGATGGMGEVVATELARRGATVVLAVRDQAKGEALQRQIVATTGNPAVDLLVADLADFAAVRRLAAEFRARYAALHVLVNNAGTIVREQRRNADGVELNLAINYLAPFLLTNLLVDTFKASAPARIVNVGSNAMTKTLDLDDLQSERRFRPMAVYGRAKLALLMSGYALARRLAGTGVIVNALHPGVTRTNIIDEASPPIARPFLGLIKRVVQTPEQGARTTIYLATAPEIASITGKYFIKGREQTSPPVSYDTDLQERLWRISDHLVGLTSEPAATSTAVAPPTGSPPGLAGRAAASNPL